MTSKTVASAGVILYLNGKPFGRVTSFSWSSSTPRQAKYGIDSVEPVELIPTVTRTTGRVGVVRTHGDSGAEGAMMAAFQSDLPREKYFSLALIERGTNSVVFRADYCSLTDQSWDVPTKGIIQGQLGFEALGWKSS